MSQYTLAEIAEYLEVSTRTLQKWEDALSEYIQSSRDSKAGLCYSEESAKRLEHVAKLRDKGLSLELIQEIFAILFSESKIADGVALERIPDFTSQAMVTEITEAFHSRFGMISKNQVKFLDEIGPRKTTHKRKKWFRKGATTN